MSRTIFKLIFVAAGEPHHSRRWIPVPSSLIR